MSQAGTRKIGPHYFILANRHRVWFDEPDDLAKVAADVAHIQRRWAMVRTERRRAFKGAPFGTISIWVFEARR